MGQSAIVFACLAGLLVLGLLTLGLFLVIRRPAQNNPPPLTGPLPYGQPPILEQPKPRGLLSRPVDWIALILLVIVGGCVVNGLVNGGPIAAPGHHILYRVSGSAGAASITYYNAQGGTEQKDIGLPWETKFDMDYLDFATISAQKSGESGTITYEIFDNGKQWLTSTSTAAYGIASCSGLVGQK